MFLKRHEKYGPVFKFQMFNRMFVVTSDSNTIKVRKVANLEVLCGDRYILLINKGSINCEKLSKVE